MHELRLVAVSEDGTYAVLVVPGRGGRFSLPIDDRLRAVARGQFSRLAQYEIEVESPLRPKEIQERIRAGESADEIADAAGVPIERVRWFEGPVLAERAYKAQEAQSAMVRRPGDSGPGPEAGRGRHRAARSARAPAPMTRSGTRPSAATAAGRSSWCSAAAAGADRGVDLRSAAQARHAGRRGGGDAVPARGRSSARSGPPARPGHRDSAPAEAQHRVGPGRASGPPDGRGAAQEDRGGSAGRTRAGLRAAAEPEPRQPPAAAEEESRGQTERAPAATQTGRRAAGGRGRRAPVPSWDEIMFGSSRPRD